MYGNCNCMAPGFLEAAQHQLVPSLLIKLFKKLSNVLNDT